MGVETIDACSLEFSKKIVIERGVPISTLRSFHRYPHKAGHEAEELLVGVNLFYSHLTAVSSVFTITLYLYQSPPLISLWQNGLWKAVIDFVLTQY